MSEPEDHSTLLEEIKALEDLLAADESSEAAIARKQRNLDDPLRSTNFPSQGFGEVTPCHEPELVVNRGAFCNPKSAFEANEKLLDLLEESKRELMTILEKCIENKSIIEERINECLKSGNCSKILIGKAGMPYFKDAKQFMAPKNDDTLEKIRAGELRFEHMDYTCPWTAKDRNILRRAIKQETARIALGRERLKGGDASVVAGSSGNVQICTAKSLSSIDLPKNFKVTIGRIGAKEFDWMKIAATDFEGRHAADECRVMWRVFLHPDVNRHRWTKEEDRNIEKLSKVLKYQDWDALAEKLGTDRSGYQCFIRYNTINNLMCSKERAWSVREDRRLRDCVEKFKIGHYIPWNIVGQYMYGRSKVQAYYRWEFNAAPHLKKGRFTPEEDATLLNAVKKYGTNFGKISTYIMPDRSTVQLSVHYNTLMLKELRILNVWSAKDDWQLVKSYKKYGADWSRIANKFPNKNRTQLRHRYKAIMRQWETGVSFYEFPRCPDETEGIKSEKETKYTERLKRSRMKKMKDKYCKGVKDVDTKLIEYFKFPPPSSTPGRKPKYYGDEELKDKTQKLSIILKTLNVDLDIPEELDDPDLTEKEMQLLVSLKNHQQSQIDRIKSLYENVEPSNVVDESNDNRSKIHFIPLCLGNCNIDDKPTFNDTMDCEYPEDLDYQIKLNMKFETPTIVNDFIDSDENDEFDHLTKVLTTQKIEDNTSKVLKKIYLIEQDRRIVNNCEEDDNARRTKKFRRKSRRIKWDSNISEGIISCLNAKVNCIEPNYHTLLGLKHISLKEEDITDCASTGEDTISRNCKRSMETLKKRMIQLFKYPIGLSHVLRPEVFVRKAESLEIMYNDEKLDDSSGASMPPAKRKRLAKKKCTKRK